MGGLLQPVCGKLLTQAASISSSQVEAVLAAYCYAKWINCGGNPSTAARKLHLLTLYLRAIDSSHLLKMHYEAFTIIAYTLKNYPTSLLDYSFTRTCASSQSDVSQMNSIDALSCSSSSPSQEAWSLALKRPKSILRRMYAVPLGGHGGGGEYLAAARECASASASASSDVHGGGGSEVQVEQLLNGLRIGFRRSVSEGTMSGLVTVGEGQEAEEGVGTRLESGGEEGLNVGRLEQMRERLRLRLRAVRGTLQGLGRGLFSAPPMYDASVLADYIERHSHMMPTHRAPGWDEEELPGWTPGIAAAH
ncbi:BQ2448_5821 [Microbotryum intermedium]|uniref:BQ2448_5821 protein n=1 Tax=Microbotryum intermedium TaxID=269621 RepID=A0A238F2E3_9BASI|nr:BQ2448_5821 [Microbotryum intermedium]